MTRHIVIAGSSGLIGNALAEAAAERGDQITRLVRRAPRSEREIQWDPSAGILDHHALARADAIVVLNGASVGRMPWTKAYREELLDSRLGATRTVVRALQDLGDDAPALVSGSAVGFYGSVPGEELTESSPAGDTFLADLCVRWEESARVAESVSRVAFARTAPVIHRQGVLKPMIALTSVGLGGKLGRGTQIWPWISLEDEVRGILHIIDAKMTGPVNLCGPTPASADTIGRELARELHRPYWLPAPAWGLKLALGKDATESLLTSDADVRPTALLESGFEFTHLTAATAVHSAIAGNNGAPA